MLPEETANKLRNDALQSAPEQRSDSQATSLSLSGLSSPGSIEVVGDEDISPNLYASAFADFTNMAESKYAGVIFTDIQESYPTDGDIICRYMVNHGAKSTGTDKVALYKIGWKETSESLAVKHCSAAEPDPVQPDEKMIVFQSSLVADRISDGEFYQFCYIAGDESIRGASTPFRVFRPNEDDFIELQNRDNGEDEDFIVVRSEQALLQERLRDLVTSNGLLEYTKRSLEQKVTSLEKEVGDLRTAKAQAESNLVAARAEIEQLKSEIDIGKRKDADCVDAILAAEEKLTHQEALVRKREADLDELTAAKTLLENNYQEVKSHMVKYRSDAKDLQAENALLRNQLDDNKAMVQTLQSNKQAFSEEVKMVKLEKEKSQDELSVVKVSLESMYAALDKSERLRSSSEESWKIKEKDMEKKLAEMTLRLTKAAQEYQERYKYSVKLESKLQRLQSKVDKFVTRPKVAEGIPDGESLREAAALQEELAASKQDEDIEVPLVTVPCSLCKESILCTVNDMRSMTAHLEERHHQRVCPVCSQMFDATMPQIDKYFHMHVENHFDVPRYPSSGDGGSPFTSMSASHI